MSIDRLSERSGGVIGTIGPIGGSGVFSLQERYALTADNYENVSLYLKMNGANGSTTFYDSSLYGHAVTANGNAQISTAQSKFGGASAAFDGSGDYLEIPTSENLAFGTGNFTIEFWFYVTSGALGYLYDGGDGGSGARPLIYYDSANINLYANNVLAILGTNGFSSNQWIHVALCRSGTSTRLFANGSQIGSTYTDTTDYLAPAVSASVGANPSGNTPMTGYIDDLRITKGVARYTGSFTPPQREFRP